jgi:rubrerythrin
MPAPAIEFSTLTLRDALDLAILIDEEAEERYEELADQMEIHHTPQAASFFHWMSGEERQHAARLRCRREQLFHGAGCRVSRAMLWDVKAPEYDQVHAFMTLREAMQAALGAEEKAEAFFDSALREVRDRQVAALFGELRRDEALVHDQVEKDLTSLPPEPGVSDEEYADEPVGH